MTHKYREQSDVCQMGREVLGGLGEKGRRIKKYKLVVTEQSWDVKYSIGETVSNTVITM